jgi:exonuclease III
MRKKNMNTLEDFVVIVQCLNKGGVMALVRNKLNASETKVRRTGEAEYIQTRIITTTCTLDLVNYYCPNKSLDLDINSQS